MKITSNLLLPESVSPTKAEVISTEGGKSLVLVNGRPVTVDGEYAAGEKISAPSKSTITPSSEVELTNLTEQLANMSGVGSKELLLAMKEYGIYPNQKTLEFAGELLKLFPAMGQGKEGLQTLAMMLLRRLPPSSMNSVNEYVLGKMQFAHLFSELDEATLEFLKLDWGEGRLLEALRAILLSKANNKDEIRKNTEMLKKMTKNFDLQEVLSSSQLEDRDNRIYFSWPMFWSGMELPDTLEGEAYVPDEGDEEQGYSLRLLLNPPNLGKMEIAFHKIDKALWIHFGVEKETLHDIRGIFPSIKQALEAHGWDKVRLTAGAVRLHDNFFLTKKQQATTLCVQKFDIKA